MEFNPSRLAQARRRRGLSQRAIAQLIGVTDRTVRRWESEEQPPDSDHIERLAKTLNFSTSYFFRADPEILPVEAVSFRALTKARAADRERAVTAGEMALELNDWLTARFNLPQSVVPDFRHYRNNPEGAAIALRSQWGLGDKPIANMVHLLEHKGVRVFSLAEDCLAIDAYSFWQGDTPFVFLNTLKSSERSRFDAAHELAHLVLHRHGGIPDRTEEREANAFAGAFLMPASSIAAYAPRVPAVRNLVQAKHHWKVAVSALAYRLKELERISEWQYWALCRDIQAAGYRTNEPESCPREFSQVFKKILEALKTEHIGKKELAIEMGWSVDDINALMFGLILSAIEGRGHDTTPASKATLRLIT